MNILSTYYELEGHNVDLNVDHYGAEQCDKNYSFGPSIRNNYVLHFIVSGKGRFTVKGKTTNLQAGDLFILPQNEVTFYQADAEEPWSYIWVGFSGTRAQAILQQTQLLDSYFLHSTLTSPILATMQKITQLPIHKLNIINELSLVGQLQILLAQLIDEFPKEHLYEANHLTQNYVQQAIKMIHNFYNTPLKVAEIAEKLSLNRSYLYKIFKKETGYAIKEYILQVKMERSCELLLHPDLSITEVAYSVGYLDPLAFSSVFKHYFHLSPSDYRKQHAKSGE
ncbi:AraC family transcriptional regulator [Streptococcus cuniculi]|uniref:AraC family transcriptional regulator n=1 Tax=Streptococcus cuniculi TaxID=1432788 RepID=A0A4Y9JA57_9STRE|nr:AraC family transcriptional regulator [Streptococcus cuniculi]MBF0779179.1 AraC family transcriptional regulator [Streptococcus cuniculi]TFU96839.1 AraC family transcriptional regulator [Streptococcus cuniculi]